ncbi:COP9 signalosome complex subunit 3 [Gossypium australe]|uniref:COP9 signalosome complex subunit 3 n=1 Tax=Gossypium australe TaxID=47621 RepID=A0A5B6V4F7_9ROSI|nr:COP9 signalosome complex subunit 3 [Gossypium australe]
MCLAVISVCKSFKDQVLLLEEPLCGVAPMLTAVRKLQSSTEHLTTLHPKFLLLCLVAKCYKTGLSILEEDIFEVDQPRDLYLYCYYGGMICIRQKSFQKALELLHNVVTAPMSTINAIAVEAYKKYILVSLIHHGRLMTLSKKLTVMDELISCDPLYLGKQVNCKFHASGKEQNKNKNKDPEEDAALLM